MKIFKDYTMEDIETAVGCEYIMFMKIFKDYSIEDVEAIVGCEYIDSYFKKEHQEPVEFVKYLMARCYALDNVAKKQEITPTDEDVMNIALDNFDECENKEGHALIITACVICLQASRACNKITNKEFYFKVKDIVMAEFEDALSEYGAIANLLKEDK